MTAFQVALAVGGGAVAGGFMATILAGILEASKKVIVKILELLMSIVIVRKEFADGNLGYSLVRALWTPDTVSVDNQADKYWFGFKFVRPLGEYRQTVIYRPAVTWKIFWKGKWPLLWVPRESMSDYLFFIRGTVDFKELMLAAEEEFQSYQVDAARAQRQFRVVRHYGTIGQMTLKDETANNAAPPAKSSSEQLSKAPSVCWSEEELGVDTEGCELASMSLRPELHEVVRRVRFWKEHRAWYRERGLAHRLGAGFYGVPGTGKTSLARAMAQDIDIPVHIFDISSMTNRDFFEAWQNSRGNGPRMVLLEDFDATFVGRENVANKTGGLTFDTLLNVISGIEREDGLLLVLTTNHINRIDPAMGVPEIDPETGKPKEDARSTRPGRINLVVEVKHLDTAGRAKMAARIVRDPEVEAKLVFDGDGDTADQFEDRCSKAALAALWGYEAAS